MHIPPKAHIHLIAICGTAMASLAGMLKERGYFISGSDHHIYPPMSTYLEELGIDVQEGFSASRLDPPPDLVVVGNAVSRGNPEVEITLNKKIPYLSLPEVLKDLFLRGKRPIVITGTHGKTTTTAITAHLLNQAGLAPSYLVAGLPRNFQRSYQLGKGEFFVIEGDEYDSAFFAKTAKFFHYLPEILILNNIEFDHADIYDDLNAIKKAFAQLINMVPQNGLLLAGADDPVISEVISASFAPVQTFGFGPMAYWRAAEIEVSPRGHSFTALREGKVLGRFELPLTGKYNIRNALAALGAGIAAGLTTAQIQSGFHTFKGIKRRQECLGKINDIILIDDFAHHPTAVEQTLLGLRQAHPNRRMWAVFEPASATNARALFEDRYLRAFAPADQVIIGKVPRPERARQDQPFSPARIVQLLRQHDRRAWHIPTATDIVGHILSSAQSGDIVVFMSNSGFGHVQRTLLEALQEKYGT